MIIGFFRGGRVVNYFYPGLYNSSSDFMIGKCILYWGMATGFKLQLCSILAISWERAHQLKKRIIERLPHLLLFDLNLTYLFKNKFSSWPG
jgi:hypothetical protein